MDRDLVLLFLIINLGVAIFYYLNRGVEIPLFLALFNVINEYRIYSLELGLAKFVSFDYKVDLEFSMELAYLMSDYIFLGSTILMYAFILFYKPVRKKTADTDDYLKDFVLQNKNYILMGLGLFSLLQLLIRGGDTGSYGFMVKLANSSFILLFFLIYHYTDTKKMGIRMVYLSVGIVLAFITYSPSMRFQFLGWIIPLGYFLVRNISKQAKLIWGGVGLFVLLVVFSAAGVMRYESNLSYDDLYEESVDRLEASDDVNFIDGFMIMYQIYPQYLDHTYGMEHLNVLLRPIPRGLWPGKPLAGWFQNYREKYGVEFADVGISPTIWGVFYAEAGEFGIVLFSVLWGGGLAWLYRKFQIFKSDLSFILIGILLACLIPVFRSGDLPGDIAIVLMSFWPMIVFVNKYKKYVEKRLRYES